MRKLIVFICAALVIYFIFDRKKHEPKAAQISEVEETVALEAQTEKTEIKNNPVPTLKTTSATIVPETSAPALANAAGPANNQPTPEKKESLPDGITNGRLLSDTHPSYTPPAFLTGISAITAKYMHVWHVVKNAALPDIQSTFNRSLPLSKFISEGLKFPREYQITIHFDDSNRDMLPIEMKFAADYSTEPMQGRLSIKVNGVEKSCDAAKVGPLKSLKMLPEENSVLLIGACDKSFYMQLYYNGTHDFLGNYYERVNGRYQRTGEVIMSTRFND